jgi:hypothetical protein
MICLGDGGSDLKTSNGYRFGIQHRGIHSPPLPEPPTANSITANSPTANSIATEPSHCQLYYGKTSHRQLDYGLPRGHTHVKMTVTVVE